ncbi:MAG: hypothetical protein SFX19_06765 [Alphaproteobacteria bacterium]|nr:hypothetical protein [Alphaproteobacteria bacterium]
MSDKNLNALKTLVISMGIVLVLGFLVVGAAVWMKIKGPPSSVAASGSALPAQCPGGAVNLKGRGQIVDTAIEGSTLRLAFAKAPGELEMVHIDLCSGKEISALKIATDSE